MIPTRDIFKTALGASALIALMSGSAVAQDEAGALLFGGAAHSDPVPRVQWSIGLEPFGERGGDQAGFLLGLDYGTRLSPTVSLTVRPRVDVGIEAERDSVMGDGQASNPAAIDGPGISFDLRWRITDALNLTGSAGAARSDDLGALSLDEFGVEGGQVDVFTGFSLGYSF